MTEYVFKLPDLGEGTVEAEIVEWHVSIGDEVREGDVIVDVMTDKANVEVPAPVDGKVLRTSGEPGDVVAVGSELIAFESQGGGRPARRAAREPEAEPDANAAGTSPQEQVDQPTERQKPPAATAQRQPADQPRAAEPAAARAPAEDRPASAATQSTGAGKGNAASADRVITSPAIRRRAKEAGIDLRDVAGSGPRGRILRDDLESALQGRTTRSADTAPAASPGSATHGEFEESKVIGVRRVIAERMSQSKREIPHFAYVEEVDVTELEALRRHLGERHQRRLTVLPFIAIGLVRALAEFPQCNARFDAERGMLQKFAPVHLGIATQTDDGLKVPVVRDAQRLDVWRLAEQIAEVAEAARSGKAGRNELAGSTITITSLGRMGGIVTTPVINYPEVAIIGVNKAIDRPVVVDGQVRVRTMMNLSSSFDHRFVDGFDAAAMIQALKGLLEHPATLFVDGPG